MAPHDIVDRLRDLALEFESVAAADEDDSADLAAAGTIRGAIAEITALRAALAQHQGGAVVARFPGGCVSPEESGMMRP